MAYDEELADRVRGLLRRRKGFSEKKMFGGICFLLDGNMCCGPVGKDLMVRLGNEGSEQALAEPFTRPMDFTGKPMRSMIFVEAEGLKSEASLKAWVDRGVAFVRTLPPK